VLLQCARESANGILTADRSFKALSAVQLTGQVTSVLGVGVAFLLHGGMTGVVLAILVAELTRISLLWVLGARAAERVIGPGWMTGKMTDLGGLGREMLRSAVLINIGGTFGSLQPNANLLVLGFLRSPVEVAYFSLAGSIAQIATVPIMPLATVAFPEFSSDAAAHSWAAMRRHMRRGSEVAAAWLLPVSVGLVIAAPLAIGILYGPSFRPAVPALAILLVGLCFDGAFFWTRGLMLSLGRPGYLTGLNLVTVCVGLVLSVALVPIWGYLGMALAQSAVLVGGNVVVVRRSLRELRLAEGADQASSA